MSQPLIFSHFDTIDRASGTSPFNCNFVLPTPLKNLSKIFLKSIELPVGWFNVREPQTFQLVLSNQWNALQYIKSTCITELLSYTQPSQINTLLNKVKTTVGNSSLNLTYIYFQIPANVYSIQSLIDTINNGISNFLVQQVQLNPTHPNIIGDSYPILSVPESGNYNLNVVLSCDANYVAMVGTSNLINRILGFSLNQSSAIFGSPITAPRLYELYSDTHISLYFPNIPHNNTNFNNKFCSFKIPIATGLQTILYSGDSREFTQYLQITDANFILTNISLIVYDRYGKEITNGTLYDWSFTLGFEFNAVKNYLTLDNVINKK